MLQSFTIKDFKSYSEAILKMSPLTVLVGANASGKSNALEAIRFLTWLAQGQKLSALQYKLNRDEQVVRGYMKDLFRHDMPTFTLGCTFKTDNMSLNLSISFDIRSNDELHIVEEKCGINEGILYQTIKPTKDLATDISVKYHDFFQKGKKSPLICTDQQAIFTQLGSAARFADEHTKAQRNIPLISDYIENQLTNILFLDPLPNLMREYSFISDKALRNDGSNLSAVLYNLWNKGEREQKNILNFIQSLPEQDIKSIDFLKGPRGEVMVQLIETFGNKERKIDANLLSDGTLRVLAIAAALLSARVGSVVIIEEIDNGVHPNRIKKLLKFINSVANLKKLNILISSHNPALLDSLPIEAIPHVVFCYRDKEDGNSKLVSLEDLPDYPELIAQGSLGDLVSQGVLEKFVKNFEGEEIKKQKALEWLEAIQ